MDHFASVPLLVDESGVSCSRDQRVTVMWLGTYVECKHPYPREVNEFDEYHEVTCHFVYGYDESVEVESNIGLSVSLV